MAATKMKEVAWSDDAFHCLFVPKCTCLCLFGSTVFVLQSETLSFQSHCFSSLLKCWPFSHNMCVMLWGLGCSNGS